MGNLRDGCIFIAKTRKNCRNSNMGFHQQGTRFLKWSWMANLAVSLLILTTFNLQNFADGFEITRGRGSSQSQSRETNPPFQFAAYSDETEDQDDMTTTEDPLGQADGDNYDMTTISTTYVHTSNKNSSKNTNSKNFKSSSSGESEIRDEIPPTPSFYDTSSSQDDLSAEGAIGRTTYTSLLSPLPTTSSSTPFSAILANKTARNFSNRIGTSIRGLDPEEKETKSSGKKQNNKSNANSVIIETIESVSQSSSSSSISDNDNSNGNSNNNNSNGSLLRAPRPTSPVISYNPSNYNRVVKRRKITSISGRNITRTATTNTDNPFEVDLTTTNSPSSFSGISDAVEEDIPSPTTITTTIDQSQSSHFNNSSSRAIAGFSKGQNQHHAKAHAHNKSRPKPIIIRDHEAYFKNVSSDTNSNTTETAAIATTIQDIEELDGPTDQPPPRRNSLTSSSPFKIRKVKVTMRRPGAGVVSTDLVEFVTPPSTSPEPTIASSVQSSTTSTPNANISLMAEEAHDRPAAVDYDEIHPSTSVPYHRQNAFTTQQPVVTSRRVFKEEFGVERDSYGHGDEDDDELEADATTEHYYAMVPPPVPTGPSPTGSGPSGPSAPPRYNSNIESSMSTDEDFSGRVSTPKYRDYFAEINPSGSGSDSRDNLNHLYNNNNNVNLNGHPDSSTSAVTVTVTKTVLDSIQTAHPFDFDHANPNINSNTNRDAIIVKNHVNQNQNNLNNFVQPTPVLPANIPPASPTPFRISDTNHDNVNVNQNHQQNSGPFVTNSVVEDVQHTNNSNATPTDSKNQNPNVNQNQNNPQLTPTTPNPHLVSSKDVTSVYYTKVEEPHFTSSSYEFTTSKEYSYYSPDPYHHNDNHNEDESHDDHAHAHEEVDHLGKGQDLNPTTTQPFWDNRGTIPNNNVSASDQTPVIVDQSGFSTPQIDSDLSPPAGVLNNKNAKNLTESQEIEVEIPEISATEQILPSESENNGQNFSTGGAKDTSKGSSGDLDKGKGKINSNANVNGSSVNGVNFPALYQVPVLVKMVLEVPQSMFCSHLANFKEMIVMVYADRHSNSLSSVDQDQIVIFTEPNCTSSSTFSATTVEPDVTSPHDFVSVSPTQLPTKKPYLTSTESSGGKILPPRKNETISDKNSSVATTLSTTVLPNESTKKSVLRRRRRSPQKLSDNNNVEIAGESLILDRKKNLGDTEDNSSNGNGGFYRNSDNLTKKEADNLAVYFFVNDKQGNYDQELTMAFFAFWNESIRAGNESFFEGIFYQRVKKVDMISSSQLVSTPDDNSNENSGIIAAIAIASIAAACLFLIGILLLVLRHRQAQTKFAKRCTPVTLDDFSLDNISFSNSFRRKQRLRGSKRSYTNAAFDDHSAPSRVVNSTTLHAALTDASGLETEFKGIPTVSPTLDDIPQGAETKNRYANVIPMPDTRVLLTFQEEQPNSDYINANYVRGPNGEPKRYIITQGPLEETMVDFWRMVWEQQVRVIFMLTDFAEAGIAKCAEYYPRSETIDCSQLHGDFQVTLEKRDITENCITSYLVIKDMERNLRRDVIHLWYHSWPDKGVPPSGKPTADFLLKSRKFTKEPTPILVHCSPGTGRSGTIVACDIAMKEFEIQQKVDIPRLVLKIRQDRAGAVQTKEQYLHIYEVLHYYASRISATQIESIP